MKTKMSRKPAPQHICLNKKKETDVEKIKSQDWKVDITVLKKSGLKKKVIVETEKIN